ncbi:EamA family transporter [Nakamurella deserti]|uniref:EamA family transporter n=1 Tax=Nakamurella deserti TaxID=2164074 RepID=UPI000DBE84DD|nr:DMT family transporter [Nakamurella deserti]
MANRDSAAVGLVFAVLSAASFGTSGTFGSSLITAGWSPPLVILIRISLGALVLALPAALALRGRWRQVWASRRTVVLYGVLAVASAQVFYFNAVQRLSVGVALLLEYLGVVLVVVWMWLRHDRRPHRLTVCGSVLALVGLALVLDLLGGTRIDLVGALWGLGAAVGLAAFFVISARSDDALPPVAMAALGMGVGAVVLLVLGLAGALPFRAGGSTVVLAGATVAFWVPFIGLSVVAAAFAYAVGVVAARRLGATVASFVGLTEVLFAVLFAWLLLDQLPGPIQLVGGVFIVGGVAVVRIDELRRDRRAAAVLVGPPGSAAPASVRPGDRE